MKRSGFAVMARLIGLVRPLAGYMVLAVTMGLAGHLCATCCNREGNTPEWNDEPCLYANSCI